MKRTVEDEYRSHALAALIRHYALKRKRSLEQVADELDLDYKKMANFLTFAGGPHEAEIKKAFAHIFKEEAYRKNKPAHILAAILEVYDLHPTHSIVKVFSEIASDDAKVIRQVSDCYAGIWHMFRYAAHDTEEAELISGKDEPPVWDAMVVRTAVLIEPCDEEGSEFPHFEIAYRPRIADGRDHIMKTVGSLVPLSGGPYMGFFGVEEDTGYPLDIRAQRARKPPSSFKGIVKRHLITEGNKVVTAKLAFVRHPGPQGDVDIKWWEKEWQSVLLRIGVFRESELIEACKDELPTLANLLTSIVNTVKYGGKSSLWLQ